MIRAMTRRSDARRAIITSASSDAFSCFVLLTHGIDPLKCPLVPLHPNHFIILELYFTFSLGAVIFPLRVLCFLLDSTRISQDLEHLLRGHFHLNLADVLGGRPKGLP